MQDPGISTNGFADDAKIYRLSSSPAQALTPSHKASDSVLLQLLAASKEAERLIACVFELHFVTTLPLRQIWERLATAITVAQQALRAQHKYELSRHPAIERTHRQGGQ